MHGLSRRNKPLDQFISLALLVTAMEDRDEMVLTGLMAVWIYLVVFHAVVHAFRRVYYDDGRGDRVLVTAHTADAASSNLRRKKV